MSKTNYKNGTEKIGIQVSILNGRLDYAVRRV